ncbi:hypothetical protein ACP275_14G240700 [Erythranthe tilingii]
MIYSNGMGAKKSIHAGNAKVDFNVDFTHKLCAALMLHPFRNASGENSLSLIIGSLCVKHPNLFGQGEKLHFLWDKGLRDSNILFTYRKPKSEWLLQHGFTIQHTLSPELGIHGIPVDNLSRIVSGGVNLSRFSAGVDLVEPANNNWSIKTSVKFEHVRPVNEDGRSISRDLHGLPVTCSGGYYDSMVVVKQESRYAEANDRTFSQSANRTGNCYSFKVADLQQVQVCCIEGTKAGTRISSNKPHRRVHRRRYSSLSSLHNRRTG